MPADVLGKSFVFNQQAWHYFTIIQELVQKCFLRLREREQRFQRVFPQ